MSDLVRSRITDLNHSALSLAFGSYSSDIISWGFIAPEYWRNYRHTHSFHEVCYAFAGHGTFRILNHESDVRVGQLFVAKPGESHEIISSHDDPLGICFWAFTLISPHHVPPARTGTAALVTAYRSSLRSISDHVPTIPMTLHLLADEVERSAPGHVDAILALASKLLLETFRSVVDARIPVDEMPLSHRSSAAHIADRIARYLQDNYTKPVTVRDVAAQVHTSERHTNRVFGAQRGQTIRDYLTTLRIDTAQRLLLDQELTIRDVAHAVGYSDIHYFTTLFHRRTGLPPATFRKQNGTLLIDGDT